MTTHFMRRLAFILVMGKWGNTLEVNISNITRASSNNITENKRLNSAQTTHATTITSIIICGTKSRRDASDVVGSKEFTNAKQWLLSAVLVG